MVRNSQITITFVMVILFFNSMRTTAGWHVVTTVAFPQKIESILSANLAHKKLYQR